MHKRLLAAFVAVPLATAAASASTVDYSAEIEAWRSQRVERLQRPDGWLTLVGLHWLAPGQQTAGRAADRTIRLAVGPDHFGEFEVAGEVVRFTPAPAAGISVDGKPLADRIELGADSSAAPTVLAFNEGKASVQLIERGGRFALRVRDANAPNRSGFKGLDYFAIDLAWRVEARFEPHEAAKTIDIATVINTIEPMPNPGAVVFERDGKTYRLEAVDEGDGALFLIFADRTNGRDTYGPGRFLYADPPKDGRTVVDFNKAYNPPCAFNEHSTCPLPPPENRLDLAVTAGEKKYVGAGN